MSKSTLKRLAEQKYPEWICKPCGDKYGNRPVGLATWHVDTCDVCGEVTEVTEPRDFGHLKQGWENDHK
jgi:hypothetical protein